MLLATLAALALAAAPPADTAHAALRRELARAAAEPDGVVGVAILHLESGDTVSLRGGERFPMQSVFKVPVALAILRRVDAGELRLDRVVPVAAADLRPGHSPIAEAHPNGGARYTVRELLRLMVAESDNTAADLLLSLAGGPAAVTANLRAHGVAGVRVDRGEGRLALDLNGIEPGPGRTARGGFDALRDRVPAATRRAALRRYLADPRDTATPTGAAAMLARLQQGRLLSPASTALMLGWMRDTPTGPARLKAGLPAGTVVAHKTGSAQAGDAMPVVNDVGIITLPGGRGHLVVAVFVKDSQRGLDPAEYAIARIARAAYAEWAARR